MAENLEFGENANEESKNTLSFEEKVIKKIAGLAASEIPGILAMSGSLISGITDKFMSADDPTRGINVEVGTKETRIDMRIICEYGQHMPQLFDEIVSRVSKAINEMTGLEVSEINVHVADVLLKDDFEAKKRVEVSKVTEELLPEAKSETPDTIEVSQ